MSAEVARVPDVGHCVNCGGPLGWHGVGQVWIHTDRGHLWCFPERQGYDQPKATAPAHLRKSAERERTKP